MAKFNMSKTSTLVDLKCKESSKAEDCCEGPQNRDGHKHEGHLSQQAKGHAGKSLIIQIQFKIERQKVRMPFTNMNGLVLPLCKCSELKIVSDSASCSSDLECESTKS